MRTEHDPRRWRTRDRLHEEPTGELVADLVHEAEGMLRDELTIAKAEIREEARKAARGGAALGAGGAILYGAFLCLVATVLLAFATFLPAWLSALITAGIFGVIGGAALAYGRQKLTETEPSRAVEHLKEDQRWARQTMQSVRSRRDASA